MPKKKDIQLRSEAPTINDLLTEEQQKILESPTPKKFIYQREGPGGRSLDYVSIGYVNYQLNKAFGMAWATRNDIVSDMSMVSKTGQVVIKVTLSVRLKDGFIVERQQFGSATIKLYSSGAKQGRPVDIGNDYKSAGSDGLKKCASSFGVAQDVFFRDWAEFEKEDKKEEEEKKEEKEKEIEAEVLPTEPDKSKDDEQMAKSKVFELLKARGWDKEEMQKFLRGITGKDSIVALDAKELKEVLKGLN